ncbi:MAG: S41 family peptidase [Acidobacteriaceae bacterium]
MSRSFRLWSTRFCAIVLGFICLAGVAVEAYAATPLLLRNPSLSKDKIAFLYGDDIWTVSRNGGEAQRLTSTGDVVEGPYYSPDGTQIAYSAHTHGAVDVYLIPAEGGIPQRLTWHPEGNYAIGWTPDGKDVLFDSMQSSYSDFFRIYRVHADGTGTPTPLPLPTGFQASYSPDGKSLAYEPVLQWQQAWKRYRGGQTTPIWIVDLKTLDLVKVPRDNSNDKNPLWVGSKVYFLSDRNGPVTLFAYDTKSKAVTQVVENKSFDLKTAAAGPGAIVYEQFGSIHLYDLATGQEHPVAISIHGDLPRLEPQLTKISPKEIQNAEISPTGMRAVFEAHGDIFTVPAEKGDTRNLTNTSSAAEREPAWSPDGKSIAYFSDASGEYQLYIKPQEGLGAVKVIPLGEPPSYFYSPRWSPDSKKIVYEDKRLNLWYVDVADGKPVKVDTGIYGGFNATTYHPSWSPDSKWLAYTRDLDNQMHAVFLYSLETHTSTQVTDGMSDAAHAVFDPNGKYLYFTASTDDGPSTAGIDLSSLDRAETSSPYVIVLAKDGASPLPPESDDEKVKDEKKADSDKSAESESSDKTESDTNKDKKDAEKKAEKPVTVKIDLAGIGNRILALPVPARNYQDLFVGQTGVIYLAEGTPVGRPSKEDGPGILSLWRFTLKKRKTEELLQNLDYFTTSFDGKKVLYARQENWVIASADDLKPGSPEGTPGKPLNMGGMEAKIDLRAEWKQMYRETWRIERDFFYDPNHHGLSIPKIEARYQPYLAGLASRDEFTYLSNEMLGEMTVGHMFVRGPQMPDTAPKTGLLGADYVVENGRYKFAKIYGGQNWTPALTSPLTQPGVDVKEGEYLLAVNGRELHASDNLYSFFDGLAGKQTVLHVGPHADGTGARDVTVVPIDSEHALRNLEWIQDNIKKVDKLSDGKVAYVYMPNTAGAGYTNFNRYFYSQLNKQALVLDERYNEGGLIADYIVDVLRRTPLSGAIGRDGKPVHDPAGAIFGPKAMIINQSAGSGGDAMPWYFRKAGLGKLVGTRTWGGLVGIGGYPTLLDGGTVTAPRYAIYGLHGQWEVENYGIPPDVTVQELPKDVAAGHDVQLETAVKLVLDELKEHPIPAIPVPPYPNYHKNDGLGIQ